MSASEGTAETGAQDIRPVVGRPVSNRGLWIFAACLGVAGVTLFSSLSARRAALSSPAITAPAGRTGGAIAPPPELVIPPATPQYFIVREGSASPLQSGYQSQLGIAAPTPSRPRSAASPSGSQPVPSYSPQEGPAFQGGQPIPPSPGFAYQSPQPRASVTEGSGGSRADTRANASRLLNPATTVPQGTVIQAVMETALDSTRAGFARAIVSRDVSSFDGSRVLIPKGSKLFGEYKADLTQGQNRALIQWKRLTRPDGAIIDVDSPSADPLGRAGSKGKVNSHFFARFGGAILQSVLDIGVQTAARRVSRDTVILNLPNSSSAPAIQKPEDIRPTLTIRQGASVSVFVGRDLDFTSVEQ